MWQAIEPLGRNPETGGYRRYAWTAVDHDLREWFVGEAQARGLDVVEDRAGNQWAWWGDPDQTPGIVLGSHLDSVPEGGAFDGPLGVVSAFAALDAYRSALGNPAVPTRPIGIANFTDEEGARFGVACSGSRFITGALTPEKGLALRDADGISVAEAWRAAGRDPETLGPDPAALARIGAFVELHVEQGKTLAADPDQDHPIAIGSDIWPHGRWRIDVPGTANHAGTTALDDRDDAMLNFARVVLAARAAAHRNGCVATVGKVAIAPNGVNAIASHATAWLDARGADEGAVRHTVKDVTLSAQLAVPSASVTEESWTPTTHFDADLIQRLQLALPGAPVIGTGAGHDAGVLATAGIPTAMLFVRNPTGVSHSPAEYAEWQDCERGVVALTDVVAALAAPRSGAAS